MLGTALTSASCCVAAPARASTWARSLAIGMVLVMAAVVVTGSPEVRYAGGALLLALASALLAGGPALAEVDLHRTAGATLMALAILLARHAPMAGMNQAGMTQAGGYEVANVALRTATAAYVCWTAVTLVRLRHRPLRDLLRWEHAAMAASVAVMVAS